VTEFHAQAQQQPIAVVGIGAMYPGSTTAPGFWQDIVRARDLMTEVPDTHWLIEDYYDPDPARPDKTYCRRGAFLPPVEFDPMEFGIPPAMLRSTDTSQLLSLIVARDVLDDVFGGRPAKLVRDRTSVILGFSGAQELISPLASRLQRPIWAKAMREHGVDASMIEAICDRITEQFVPWDEASFPGLLGNVVAGRVANRLDLHGANLTVDAACASSLAAVHTAVNQLLLGEADLAIAGGADANNDIFVYLCFSKTPALSRTEDCRPFSDQADGTMMGEGIGMVALKRLADAERDGNRVYAVLRGVGASSDGRSRSIYAPRSDGQALALARCYSRAGYGPETVELVEAHGTGTRAGDLAEMEGLREVFGGAPQDGRHPVALGSVKSQIGHTKAAAGAAGLLKMVMALHQKVLPPTIKVDRPDPGLKLAESPFYLNTTARPWVRDGSHPRRASVSAFGFGGTNYHVTLEEYEARDTPAATSRLRTASSELFLVSGQDSTELARHCTAMSLEKGDHVQRAYVSQHSFDPAAAVRLAVVADSAEDLAGKLAKAAAFLSEHGAGALATPDGVFLGVGPAMAAEVAVLFPGQGSQYVGMGAGLAMAHPCARSAWDAAAGMRFDGLAVHDVVFPAPAFSDTEREALEVRLRATEWAQPALGVAGMAGWALLSALEVRPRWFLGHSFGELTALHAAGALPARDLLALARVRGELMRDASSTTPGGMTAVFASSATVASLISRSGIDAVIANYNTDAEVIVSGGCEALDQIEQACAGEQIIARRLPVAAAFHSPAVAGAAISFAGALADADVRRPLAEVLGNADALPYPDDPDAIRRKLADQLAQPVRFADMIRTAYERGARVFVEAGPGTVLSDLTRRILKDEPHLAVSIDRKHRDGVTSLHHALAQLAVAGLPVHWPALWEAYQPPAAQPTKRPGATVTLTGTNHGKPYPASATQRLATAAQSHVTVPQRPGAASRHMTGAASAAAVPSAAVAAAPAVPLAPAVPARTVPAPAAAVSAVPPGPALRDPGLPAHCHPLTHFATRNGSTSAPGLPEILDGSWAQAYDAIQRRVADTHIAVTRAMADMHAAFLASMTSAFSDPGAMAPVHPLPILAPPQADTAAMAVPSWPAAAAAGSLDQPAMNGLPPMDATVPGEPARPVVGGPQLAVDVPGLLLSVIAEKTGYQQDMLAMHMELEADLGIDSIKRVEILAAMRDAVPALPDVDPAAMAGIRTLGDVVAHLQGGDGRTAEEITSLTTGSAPAPVPAAPVPATERWALRMTRHPALGLSLAGLRAARRVAVTDDGAGIAACVVNGLAAAGVAAEAVAVAEVTGDADAVIFLGGLRAVDTVAEAVAVNREAFGLARAIAPRFSDTGGVFVTVQDTGGDFGMAGGDEVRAWLAGVAALARTARREWQAATVKVIDCQRGGRPAAEVAEAIVAELLAGAESPDIALTADGRRQRPVLERQPAGEGTFPVGEGAVVVASGGARGVTAACLEGLARACHPHLVLLGRTAMEEEPSCCAGALGEVEITKALIADARREGRTAPSPAVVRAMARSVLAVREVRKTMQALEDAGARVSYFPVDVRDEAAVTRTLTEVRARFGPVRGLVHGVGVLADKLIADKTDDQFDAVFDTKISGLRALLAATEQDPLACMFLFSSVVAQEGNPGQADYAMANEILNHVACAEQARRGDTCTVRAIGWGPWDGGMVTPALRDHFSSRGVSLLATEAGRRAFIAESKSAGGVVVVIGSGGMTQGPPSTGHPAEMAFDIWVDRERNPYLADHAIGNLPVVPVALAAEWFHRAIAETGHGRVPVLRSLKVLGGVKLDPLLQGESLRLTRRFEDGHWRMFLVTGQGQPAYSAIADFDPWTPDFPAVVESSGPPAGGRPIYDGHVLFHGPAFQALRSLEGTTEGMSADVVGLTELGWPDDAWQTDPAALDAMLQLGGKWSEQLLGGATLPMGFQTLYLAGSGPVRGTARATVRTRQLGNSRAVCDIVMADAQGTLLAAIGGVDYLLRPDFAAGRHQAGGSA
jgi:acyl transferase domain-containing protein/NADP-dependent 3-hydroxy acid dehydrogenase YdfG